MRVFSMGFLPVEIEEDGINEDWEEILPAEILDFYQEGKPSVSIRKV